MKVAVIISTWNRQDLICEAVDSIVQQKTSEGEPVRAIVVDDGSTDGTVPILKSRYSLVRNSDNAGLFESDSVSLICGENRERGAARNSGARLAIEAFKSDWLMFLDSDDRLADSAVETFIQRLENHPEAQKLVAIYGNSRLWYGGGALGETRLTSQEPEGDLRWEVLTRGLFSIGSTFIRSAAFTSAGGFPADRSMSGSEDWVLHARLCFAGLVAYSPHVSLHYRRHAGNTSAEKFLQSIVQSRLHAEADLERAFGIEVRAARRRMWRHAWLSIAGTFNSTGDSLRAARILRDSCVQDPGLIATPRFWRLGASVVAGLIGVPE